MCSLNVFLKKLLLYRRQAFNIPLVNIRVREEIMKNNLLKCATFAILSAFALAVTSNTQGMPALPEASTRMFKSNFGFLKCLFGEENSMVLSELWKYSSQVEPVIITSIEDLIEHEKWELVDISKPQKIKLQIKTKIGKPLTPVYGKN